MLPRPWLLIWTLVLGLSAGAALALTGPARAQEMDAPGQEKKVIKKGSGQFEEYYELLPPEEGDVDSAPAATGNLDPEGDTDPSATAKPVKRAPVGAPKGTFGTPMPAPAAKSLPTRQPPPPAPAPEPGDAVDATLPMEEPPPAAVKKAAPAEAAAPPAKTGQGEPIAAPAKKAANLPAPTEAPEGPAAPSDTDFFKAALDQGGKWSKHGKFGDVFVPETNSDWRPYTAGRWIYDATMGWTWISDEAHGWATYHYGRWTFEAGTGWMWVPGTEWAPAWVVWRQGEDAIGWAPLPPEAQFGAKGISLDAKVIESDAFEKAWVFVAPRYFGQQMMRGFIRPTRWNADLTDRSTPILGYQRKDGLVVNRGVAVDEVSRLAGKPPQRMIVSISSDTRFKQPSFRSGEEVKIYRPDERQIADLTRKAAKLTERSAQGTAKSAAARGASDGTPAKRFPAHAKPERIESSGSVTESWAKPEAPATAKPPAASEAAASTRGATSAPAKTERVFAPAPALQRTETGGAVTESWADNGKPAAPKPAKSDPVPQPAKTDAAETAGSAAHRATPAAHTPAATNSGRGESYSVPSPEEAGDTAAAPQSAGADETQTGSTGKRRWDESGSSGVPAMVPGATP